VPLLEIVTEPEFRDAEEVDEFLKKLRLLLRYLEVSDCDMEKGSMRLEVNMSLGTQDNFNPDDSIKVFPKYKVEVKNINSFRYVQKAIKYEFARQAELLDQGKTPVQETRGYQEDVDRTISQRTKEEAQDYRYFPDPDIPPLTFNQKDLDQLKSQLPQLPEQKLAQYIDKLKLAPETAKFLVANKSLAEYFETAVEEGSKHQITPQAIAKIIKNKKLDWTQNTPETLVKKLAQESAAKITDTRELTEIILNVLKANPGQVAEYKAGKQALLGFFMGQIMAKTKGQADAKITSTILNQELKK
jgi:aspartyl-tRNA(Asn)/glutamyl-tRNA(Gln) amidotransferase subunit B